MLFSYPIYPVNPVWLIRTFGEFLALQPENRANRGMNDRQRKRALSEFIRDP